MSHAAHFLPISGGRLFNVSGGTLYVGADGRRVLFRGVRTCWAWWAVRRFTAWQLCGRVCVSRRWAAADFSVRLFAHEYGHYLQQRQMGLWRYLLHVALPSLFSLSFVPGRHWGRPFEADATRRGLDYLRHHCLSAEP